MRKKALQYLAQRNITAQKCAVMPISKIQVHFCRAQHRCSHIAAALWHEKYMPKHVYPMKQLQLSGSDALGSICPFCECAYEPAKPAGKTFFLPYAYFFE